MSRRIRKHKGCKPKWEGKEQTRHKRALPQSEGTLCIRFPVSGCHIFLKRWSWIKKLNFRTLQRILEKDLIMFTWAIAGGDAGGKGMNQTDLECAVLYFGIRQSGPKLFPSFPCVDCCSFPGLCHLDLNPLALSMSLHLVHTVTKPYALLILILLSFVIKIPRARGGMRWHPFSLFKTWIHLFFY